jgi:hypothetical protein
LRALHHNLLEAEHPETVLSWLNKKTTTQVLGELSTGTRPMTHTALDELPDTKPLRHLRSMLVATGALPPRDEQLAQLERWISSTINGHDNPDDQQMLRRYALWHLMRRLRRRTNGTETTDSQTVGVRRHLSAALVLVDWLRARGLTLHTAWQNDLESWLVSEHLTHRREARTCSRCATSEAIVPSDNPAAARVNTNPANTSVSSACRSSAVQERAPPADPAPPPGSSRPPRLHQSSRLSGQDDIPPRFLNLLQTHEAAQIREEGPGPGAEAARRPQRNSRVIS